MAHHTKINRIFVDVKACHSPWSVHRNEVFKFYFTPSIYENCAMSTISDGRKVVVALTFYSAGVKFSGFLINFAI